MAYRPPVYKVTLVRESGLNRASSQRQVVSAPEDAANIFWGYLNGADREHFVMMGLTIKGRVIGIHTVSIGTLDSTLVHPREVFKAAILMNAASIVVAHNHPSGDSEPSSADIEITKVLHNAGRLLHVELLDHLVLGDKEFYSMKKRGHLE